MIGLLKTLCRCAPVFLLAVQAHASPGDLDPTFAGTGKVRVGFGGGNDAAGAVAVQSDGKIVVAGTSQELGVPRMTVLRYNTDGSLDSSFGSGGIAVPVSPASANAAKIQADGKIVVAGSDPNAEIIVRLNADGSLDSSFGSGGTTNAGWGGVGGSVAGLAISDGMIVVAGTTTDGGSGHRSVVARRKPDGSADSSFNGTGWVQTPLDEASAVVISGNTIVVAGSSSSGHFALARYTANGSLDSSFNNGSGSVVTPIGTKSRAHAVTIQPDPSGTNKIVAAGDSYSSASNPNFTIVRYNSDGSLDTTFDGDGIVFTDMNPNKPDYINAVAIQNTGTPINPVYKIIVGGFSETPTSPTSSTSTFLVARYNSNGSLDTTFDGDGTATPSFNGLVRGCQGLALSGNKIIAVGYAGSEVSLDFATARYNTNGSLDQTFNSFGLRSEDIGNALKATAKGVAIQADGKIVVAGYSGTPDVGVSHPALVRLNPDGTLDPAFGIKGKTEINSVSFFNAVACQSDGAIVAVGGGSNQLFCYRRDPTGATPVFGGLSTGASNSVGNAVVLQADGKILVAGSTGGSDFLLGRLISNLTRDSSFGNNGVVQTDFGTNSDVANAIALQSDGKIVVAGKAGGMFAVARYNPDGSLDASFDGDGKVTTPFAFLGEGKGVAIQSDGKIVVTGYEGNSFATVRYNENGSLDSSFGATGIVVATIGTTNAGEAVTIQPNGKILVAGSVDDNFLVLSYNQDGSRDSSYTGGVDFASGSHDSAHAIALDSSGRAVVAGEADGLFGIARLLADSSINPTPTPTPTATPTATPGLVGNVATRLPVGTGDNVLIEGFTVQGPAGSTKKIIVRATGPSLAAFGVPDALPNPTLEIHDANAATVATNDDWKTTQVGGLIVGDQSAEIAGSGVAPSNDFESAIIANLSPGSYTAVVHGAGDTVGTGVVDAYDLSAASPARLANIATRGLIQPGDKLMIAGFIIQNAPVRAVVRAIGPSLSGFGISNALPDTTLQLRDSNGAIVRENDDWRTDQQQELIDIGLQPTDDREAALIETLQPGQYTAQVRGKPETTTGTGVVQVYFLQ